MASTRRPSSRTRARASSTSDRTSAAQVRASSRPGRTVTVGLTQMACGPDPTANLTRQLALAERAADSRGADHLHAGAVQVAVLLPVGGPRLLRAGRDDSRAVAPTPSSSFAKKHGVVVVASLFEKRAAGLYHNTAAVIDADGSLLGIYRKMHIPDDPLFYEKFYFTPGDTGFRAWKTRFGTIGVLICWDQWYPGSGAAHGPAGRRDPVLPHRHRLAPEREGEYGEGPARVVGSHPAQPRRRQRLLGVRAQPHRPRAGPRPRRPAGERRRPRVLGPVVRRLARRHGGGARAAPNREEVLVVECDLDRVEFARTHWPFLRDRRIDAYGAAEPSASATAAGSAPRSVRR